MFGSGCKNCPVEKCQTMNYRGSTCAAQRAEFGLGDPKTLSDHLREESDEYIAEQLLNFFVEGMRTMAELAEIPMPDIWLHSKISKEKYLQTIIEQLQSPIQNLPVGANWCREQIVSSDYVKMPCKTGDKMYFVNNNGKNAIPCEVGNVTFTGDSEIGGGFFDISYIVKYSDYSTRLEAKFNFNEIGKKIFFVDTKK